MRARGWLLVPLLLTLTSLTVAQQWFAVESQHLISYSEGNDKGAREAAQRGEQLIAVFREIFHRKVTTFATPLRVMVIHAAPSADGHAAATSTLARTPIANYVTVDFSQPESWTQAAHTIAALTLEDNYPRAQPWFDLGIASYLAGVRFSAEQIELGAPPLDLPVLPPGEWIPIGKLLEIDDPAKLSSEQRRMLEAESFVLVRWLIENSRMAQAGAYLNAVQWRGATSERAMAEAFSMSPADLDREVHESLAKLTTRKMQAPRVESMLFHSSKMPAADMHALQANLSLFGPEGEHTLKELTAFMHENQQNAMVHRSLAWAFLLRHDLDNAVENIRRALELDDSDPAMHYLYARWVNQGDDNAIHLEAPVVRMGTELKEALRRDPNYAAALELLGLAQLSDHQEKAALENLQRASAVRPRSSRYSLNLARAYEATGNLDAARNLLLYVRASPDREVASEAAGSLEQIGKQKKQVRDWRSGGLQPQPNAKHSKYDNLQDAIAEEEAEETKAKSPEAAPDTRKVENMKGRIVGVECSSTSEATLKVESAGHRWRLHVADRNNAVLIGVEHFDCGWSGLAVSINYKRAGNFQGELISLEAD